LEGVFYNIRDFEGMFKFSPIHQLVAVLPRNSKILVPKEYRHLFEENSILYDMYPYKFNIERDGKNKEHMGVSLVPLIDKQRVYFAVEQVKITSEKTNIWKEEKDLFLKKFN
jgi:5'-3' exonuclease